jgi:hypothetical protein
MMWRTLSGKGNLMTAQMDCRENMSFTREWRMRLLACVVLCLAAHAAVSQASAEVRTVNARGSHLMGERDTKEEAVRLAVESAKRNALEQVATYLESVTVVNGENVTKDEIRSFTAGLVIVLDQRMTTKADGGGVVVEVELLAQIDTEEASHAIARLRKNEEARGQLAALKRENDRLHRELNSANRELAEAPLPGHMPQAVQRRQEILYRVQSNAIVSQAWTDWALASAASASDREAGRANIQSLLQMARDLDPASPHVAVAARMMESKQPPAPLQPPSPPIYGQRQARMPRHEIVPRPGFSGTARRLNEIIYNTPASPARNGNTLPVETGLGQRRKAGSEMIETRIGERAQEKE